MSTLYIEDPTNKTVELVIDGKVTKDDFNRIASQLETFIGTHGKIKLLEVIRDYNGFEPSMVLDAIKFDFKHKKAISHCAVVTDKKWISSFSKATSGLVPFKVKTFSIDGIDDARKWLKAPDIPNAP